MPLFGQKEKHPNSKIIVREIDSSGFSAKSRPLFNKANFTKNFFFFYWVDETLGLRPFG